MAANLTRKALKAIEAGRERQVAEGHTLESDKAKNQPGQMALAGAAYAAQRGTLMRDPEAVAGATAPSLWPFDDGWNPKDTEADLIRAGACIVAELERFYAAQ